MCGGTTEVVSDVRYSPACLCQRFVTVRLWLGAALFSRLAENGNSNFSGCAKGWLNQINAPAPTPDARATAAAGRGAASAVDHHQGAAAGGDRQSGPAGDNQMNRILDSAPTISHRNLVRRMRVKYLSPTEPPLEWFDPAIDKFLKRRRHTGDL